MPFANPFPRTFSVRSVRTHAPVAPGIYGISNAREWIFIGNTDDIQGALLAHIMQQGGVVHSLAPSGFCFEVCDSAGQITRQSRLVTEYNPVANRRAG